MIDYRIDADDEVVSSLQHDVLMVLVECHRDRASASGFIREDLRPADINRLAIVMAQRLASRIGGRYVPKGRFRSGTLERATRNAQIRRAFNGRNHQEVMRSYGISRAMLYRIIGAASQK